MLSEGCSFQGGKALHEQQGAKWSDIKGIIINITPSVYNKMAARRLRAVPSQPLAFDHSSCGLTYHPRYESGVCLWCDTHLHICKFGHYLFALSSEVLALCRFVIIVLILLTELQANYLGQRLVSRIGYPKEVKCFVFTHQPLV